MLHSIGYVDDYSSACGRDEQKCLACLESRNEVRRNDDHLFRTMRNDGAPSVCAATIIDSLYAPDLRSCPLPDGMLPRSFCTINHVPFVFQ